MTFKNKYLSLLGDLLRQVNVAGSRISIGDGPNALEAMSIRLANLFNGDDIELRLIPLDQIDTLLSADEENDVADFDDDPDLLMLRMDAALPLAYDLAKLETLITCLSVINSSIPFGAVIAHPTERSVSFHYTAICNKALFDAGMILELIRMLEFYFAMMAHPLRFALESALSPQAILEQVQEFVTAMMSPAETGG